MEYSKDLINDAQVIDTYSLSVILSTRDPTEPSCQTPSNIQRLIPKNISHEIVVVHYNQVSPDKNESRQSIIDEKKHHNANAKNSEDGYAKNIIHEIINGEIGTAFSRGLKISNGQLVLVMDADYPYPDTVVSKMIAELLKSPNSIIIASRYSDKKNKQKLPLIRTALSKGSRIIIRHGLKIKDVKDPLSGCFATSRQILENVMAKITRNQFLLEILVKGDKYNRANNVTIVEIPFEQKENVFIKKLESTQIVSYFKAVWHLYRYGRKSDQITNEQEVKARKKHKSILFLSKAGRFFTVGASGLFVNYAVSLVISNTIPNIWYIYATLVGIIVSISTNFILNKVWTFEDWNFKIRHFIRQYGLFVSLCSFGAALQLSLVSVFVDYYHVPYSISLITAVCISSIGNFLLNKKITFGERIWE